MDTLVNYGSSTYSWKRLFKIISSWIIPPSIFQGSFSQSFLCDLSKSLLKNHGISRMVVWRSQNPAKTESDPSTGGSDDSSERTHFCDWKILKSSPWSSRRPFNHLQPFISEGRNIWWSSAIPWHLWCLPKMVGKKQKHLFMVNDRLC